MGWGGTDIHTTVHVPTPYKNPVTAGTMTGSGSMKTGMYLAIGGLYTVQAGIADCERWPVDQPHVASWLADLSRPHVRGRALESSGTGVKTAATYH